MTLAACATPALPARRAAPLADVAPRTPVAEPEETPPVPDEVLRRISEVRARPLRHLASAEGGIVVADLDGIRLAVAYRRIGAEAYVRSSSSLSKAAYLRDLRAAGVELDRVGGWLATSEHARIACIATRSGGSRAACYLAPSEYAGMIWFTEDEENRGRMTLRANDGAWVEATYVAHDDHLAVVPSARTERPTSPLLEPPAWSLPPSLRPRAPPPRRTRVRRTASVWPRLQSPLDDVVDPDNTVTGLAAGPGASILSLASEGEGILCVASGGSVACAETSIEELEGVAASPTDETWLIVGETSYGNPRDGARLLVLLHLRDDLLTTDELPLASVGGDGEACPDTDSYCVWLEGMGRRARWIAPDCVERESAIRWSAVHVRVGDRWRDERRWPHTPCTERFRVAEGQFVPAACGAQPSPLPACVAQADVESGIAD